ncbi:transglutaminase domain-containing protein [Anoxybacterium hadale]|uniref:Transglutaminase domain-containing protein n=1 Tax=Anoxybacterium hadale TaxID=3408580 RepID=A0ACD1ABJ7_9FIRM|nr:transglutaminase domain-containing protein [Clostridiales bacterium]
MNSTNGFNLITLLMISIFFMPIITGILNPISKNRVINSIMAIFNSMKFVLGTLLAFYFIGIIFSSTKNGFLTFLDQSMPPAAEFVARYQHDIVAYVITFFILMSVLFFLLELLAIPITRHVLIPLSLRLSTLLEAKRPITRRIFGGLWQLPRSAFMIFVLAILLNFYTNFINNPDAGEYINASKAYQTVQKTMLQPILNAELVKSVPTLVSEAFKKAAEDYTPANSDSTGDPNYWKLPAIKYFNGMTIDEAVLSNTAIDETAQRIVGNETDDRKKAELLYHWVRKNIKYDQAKAVIVLKNPSKVNSGSIITYQERTGVCFDYSCLYVSMCRAVDIKVRLVSGLGYSGTEWGEHVWNQIYDTAAEKWINVDPTFGNSGYNYFDNDDFSDTHRYDVVQAEW